MEKDLLMRDVESMGGMLPKLDILDKWDMSEKLDILLKFDISENFDEASLKWEKLDISLKPDLPDIVEPMESVDICDMSEWPRPIRFFRSPNPVGKLPDSRNPGPPMEELKDCLTDDVDEELFFTDITEPSGICWMHDSLTSAASAASERLNLPSGSSSWRDILVEASRRAAWLFLSVISAAVSRCSMSPSCSWTTLEV